MNLEGSQLFLNRKSNDIQLLYSKQIVFCRQFVDW